MNMYRMVYQTSDGYEGKVIVNAANRIAAFMIFDGLGFEDVVNVDCYRVLDVDDAIIRSEDK